MPAALVAMNYIEHVQRAGMSQTDHWARSTAEQIPMTGVSEGRSIREG